MIKIKNISHSIKKIQLTESYNLSYKTLDYYESIIVKILLNDETVLYGEVTPLIGYTDETVEDVINELKRLSTKIETIAIDRALELMYEEINPMNSFALSSVIAPIELYLEKNFKEYENVVISNEELIYALKSEQSIDSLKKEIEQLMQDGYSTVKIKVGKSLTKELELVQNLSKINLKSLKIRFDANGGYNFEEAKNFLYALEKIENNVEYLEQPLCRTSWDGLEKLLSLKCKIPMMIDESIYSLADIKKSYDIGAKFVKIKLCKYGSLYHLQEALDYANKLGLNVVFGNGVATDIANYYELIFYLKNKKKIYGATEGVGFMKLKQYEKYNLIKKVINE